MAIENNADTSKFVKPFAPLPYTGSLRRYTGDNDTGKDDIYAALNKKKEALGIPLDPSPEGWD